MSKQSVRLAAATAVALLTAAISAQDRSVPEGIRVRDGYELSIAANVEQANFLTVGPDGTIYVASPKVARVLACKDLDGDGYCETVTPFVKGHPKVHGVCWADGWLWFCESGEVYKARDTNGDGEADEDLIVIGATLIPKMGLHWRRALVIDNGRLYTAIGDAGETTEAETDRQKIFSYDLAGGDKRLFATGIRDTTKLVVRPGTHELWGMDANDDWFAGDIEKQRPDLGRPISDLNAPSELNLYEEGGFYGHPYIVGNRLPRYQFLKRKDIVELAAKSVPPRWLGLSRAEPMGMTFYDAGQFPAARGDAFIAYHGNVERGREAGLCVTRVFFDQGKPYGELRWVEFLAPDGQALARPMDCAVAADGSLLISDDHGGRIYRLRYTGAPAKK